MVLARAEDPRGQRCGWNPLISHVSTRPQLTHLATCPSLPVYVALPTPSIFNICSMDSCLWRRHRQGRVIDNLLLVIVLGPAIITQVSLPSYSSVISFLEILPPGVDPKEEYQAIQEHSPVNH